MDDDFLILPGMNLYMNVLLSIIYNVIMSSFCNRFYIVFGYDYNHYNIVQPKFTVTND